MTLSKKTIAVIDSLTLIHWMGAKYYQVFQQLWNIDLPVSNVIQHYADVKNKRCSMNQSMVGNIKFLSLFKAELYRTLCRIPEESMILIFANDTKLNGQYWRHEIFPGYKGNRGNGKRYKSTEYRDYMDIFREIFDFCAGQYGEIASVPNYEADDIWGAVWRRCKANGDKLWGMTIDFDWLQLVDDETTIFDFKYQPMIRDVPTVIDLIKEKYRRTIEHPSNIVDVKIEIGDRGDNLPAGAAKELFDLRTMPTQYHLSDDMSWYSRLFVPTAVTLEKSHQYCSQILEEYGVATLHKIVSKLC
jgi:hypothetical protein